MKISNKLKAIIAGVGLVTTPLVAATADNVINITEGQALLAAGIEAAVTIWAVWRVPNGGFVEQCTATTEGLMGRAVLVCAEAADHTLPHRTADGTTWQPFGDE